MKNFAQHLAQLQKYCAYQERCQLDVMEKMKRIKVPTNQFESIIEQLQQEGFLNEKRYTTNYVRSHFERKKWGKTKIRFSLYKKNIAEDLIHKTLQEIDPKHYHTILKELAQKKIKSLRAHNDSKLDIKKKTLAYLNQKGYELDLTHELLDNLLK